MSDDLRLLSKTRDDFNWSDQVGIELVQLFGGDPILLMDFTSDLFHVKVGQIGCPNPKSCDESSARVADVPISSNRCRVLLVQDGIEDRLPAQARRKGPIITLLNQGKLLRTDWTVERNNLFRFGIFRNHSCLSV